MRITSTTVRPLDLDEINLIIRAHKVRKTGGPRRSKETATQYFEDNEVDINLNAIRAALASSTASTESSGLGDVDQAVMDLMKAERMVLSAGSIASVPRMDPDVAPPGSQQREQDFFPPGHGPNSSPLSQPGAHDALVTSPGPQQQMQVTLPSDHSPLVLRDSSPLSQPDTRDGSPKSIRKAAAIPNSVEDPHPARRTVHIEIFSPHAKPPSSHVIVEELPIVNTDKWSEFVGAHQLGATLVLRQPGLLKVRCDVLWKHPSIPNHHYILLRCQPGAIVNFGTDRELPLVSQGDNHSILWSHLEVVTEPIDIVNRTKSSSPASSPSLPENVNVLGHDLITADQGPFHARGSPRLDYDDSVPHLFEPHSIPPSRQPYLSLGTSPSASKRPPSQLSFLSGADALPPPLPDLTQYNASERSAVSTPSSSSLFNALGSDDATIHQEQSAPRFGTNRSAQPQALPSHTVYPELQTAALHDHVPITDAQTCFNEVNVTGSQTLQGPVDYSPWTDGVGTEGRDATQSMRSDTTYRMNAYPTPMSFYPTPRDQFSQPYSQISGSAAAHYRDLAPPPFSVPRTSSGEGQDGVAPATGHGRPSSSLGQPVPPSHMAVIPQTTLNPSALPSTAQTGTAIDDAPSQTSVPAADSVHLARNPPSAAANGSSAQPATPSQSAASPQDVQDPSDAPVTTPMISLEAHKQNHLVSLHGEEPVLRPIRDTSKGARLPRHVLMQCAYRVSELCERYGVGVRDRTRGIPPPAGHSSTALLPVDATDIGNLINRGPSWVNSCIRAVRRLNDVEVLANPSNADFAAMVQRMHNNAEFIGPDLDVGGIGVLTNLLTQAEEDISKQRV